MKNALKHSGFVLFAALILFGPTAALFWLPTDVSAQQAMVSLRDPFAYESITVADSAIGLTAATVSPATGVGARQAYCTVEAASAAAMRYRTDGGDPTTTVGHYVLAGVAPTSAPGVVTLEGTNALLRFRAIRQGATSITLNCTYLR